MSTLSCTTSRVCLRSLFVAAAAIGGFALSSPASAQTAPDAHYYFGTPTSYSVLNPGLPEVATAGNYFTADGHAYADIEMAPQPTVTLNLTSATFTGAAVEYSFSITGPGFGTADFVDGTLTTSMSATGSGSYIAAGAIVATGIDRPDHTPLALDADTAVCSSTISYLPCPVGETLANHVIDVSFASSGTIELAAAGKLFYGSANVMVDPIISLPEGYTLTLSAGVGNGAPIEPPPIAAVPEPSTVMTLAGGLAMLLGVVRRTTPRRRSVDAAASFGRGDRLIRTV